MKLYKLVFFFIMISFSSYSQHILTTSIMRDNDVLQKYIHSGLITRNGKNVEIYIADVKSITSYTILSEVEKIVGGTKLEVMKCYNHNLKKDVIIVKIPKTVNGNKAWQIFINNTDYITAYEFDCEMKNQN